MTAKRIGYFSSEYPAVSHTFIRREILGLEDKGFDLERFAIRPGDALVDPADLAELEKTSFIAARKSPLQLVSGILRGLWRAKWRVLPGLKQAIDLGRLSSRGILRHVMYLLEGLILLDATARSEVTHLHVHFANNAAAVALLAKTMGGPTYSMMVHGPLEFDAPVGSSLGLKVREALFTTAISSYCSGQIRRWVEPEVWPNIHIVHCTVDDSWFDEAQDLAETARDIVCVGRLGNEKGQVLLIEAFARAAAEGLEGNLILVGDGEMRSHVEQAVSNHGLSERVSLVGWKSASEIKEIIRASRALVLASFAEGLPVVLMEAMASRRPVISTMITGVPELVKHGENGWLTISGDVESMTDALLQIQRTDIDTLRNLGASAQAAARKNHSVGTEVEKLAALLTTHV